MAINQKVGGFLNRRKAAGHLERDKGATPPRFPTLQSSANTDIVSRNPTFWLLSRLEKPPWPICLINTTKFKSQTTESRHQEVTALSRCGQAIRHHLPLVAMRLILGFGDLDPQILRASRKIWVKSVLLGKSQQSRLTTTQENTNGSEPVGEVLLVQLGMVLPVGLVQVVFWSDVL